MKSKYVPLSVIVVVVSLMLAACNASGLTPAAPQAAPTTAAAAPQVQQSQPSQGAAVSLDAYQSTLEGIYVQVNPSVVSIRVVQEQKSSNLGQNNPLFNLPGFQDFFGSPNGNNAQPSTPQYSQALGSGFVWNQDGYIVTNNHVVSGASKIEVQFADGATLSARLVGADPDSDLAVIQVDNPGFALTPITVSDSSQVKVGQVAVAIGNPFGLENTMTVGIVSALGRSLPASEGSSVNGATYTIPDIIQTDAPINPGNSGGPLVNDQGALIGVNSAIESQAGTNSGIGFAIPSTIVSRVVPELIQNGKYEHPYVGISGTSLTPDLATAMKLDATQRGALVEEVMPNSPADKANLRGSSQQTTIDGQNVNVGGDVITAIDGSAVKSMDDIIAYLADHTNVGQKVTLTFLRDGKQQTAELTLEARPAATSTQQASSGNSAASGAWLGIAAEDLTPAIAKEMNLPENQSGILVEQVQAGSPADQAGLQGSFKPLLINGTRVLVGGDVITAIDGTPIAAFDDLQAFMQTAKPGQQVKLTILRDGKEQTLTVTLAAHP
ncbi:MAG: PDZ domain-containing protein [Chloroflexi bacterium]|nr:PDZ domain-containing protein [Chloroflexota bacterium]